MNLRNFEKAAYGNDPEEEKTKRKNKAENLAAQFMKI